MPAGVPPKFDEIGYWSEVKLAIVREYAKAYSRIMTAQKKKRPFSHAYIDGFSGAGVHVRKGTSQTVDGSPVIAVKTDPPFDDYHFIDLNGDKADYLARLVGDHPHVTIYKGDCNEVLLAQVFPRVRYGEFRRALCVLDPYGLDLRWDVILAAGQSRSIEIFLNFPTMDMNRNVLWHEHSKVSPDEAARMTSFWGDTSWRQAAYRKVENLFGDTEEEKASNATVAEAFRERLRKVAGFEYVPEPMPMRNKAGAIVYYLFFASKNPTAKDIVTDIFRKYRTYGLAGPSKNLTRTN
jgi:three-Cys-motif partner protein